MRRDGTAVLELASREGRFPDGGDAGGAAFVGGRSRVLANGVSLFHRFFKKSLGKSGKHLY